MIDRIADFPLWNRLVEFVVELFATADAESMFRWVLLAWAVVVVASVFGDRISSVLLGRSKPRVQRPPTGARGWRWRRRIPPPTYSLHPVGTVGTDQPRVSTSIPLTLPAGSSTGRMMLVERRWLVRTDLDNDDFWMKHANDASPIFGIENHSKLRRGEAPERFNPLTRRVERLRRDPDTGALHWPFPVALDSDIESHGAQSNVEFGGEHVSETAGELTEISADELDEPTSTDPALSGVGSD